MCQCHTGRDIIVVKNMFIFLGYFTAFEFISVFGLTALLKSKLRKLMCIFYDLLCVFNYAHAIINDHLIGNRSKIQNIPGNMYKVNWLVQNTLIVNVSNLILPKLFSGITTCQN